MEIKRKFTDFYEIFGDCDKSWQNVLDSSKMADLSEAYSLFYKDNFLINLVNSVTSKNNPQLSCYLLQFLNIFLTKSPKIKHKIGGLFAVEELSVTLFKQCFAYKSKIDKCLQFFYNFLSKNEFSNAYDLQQYLLTSNIFTLIINIYFGKMSEEENDPLSFEYFLFIKQFTQEKLVNLSYVELYFKILKPENIHKFLNFIQISIDELIAKKQVYSVISDLEAEVLENDADFKSRIYPTENSHFFTLRKSDILFLQLKLVELVEFFDNQSNENLEKANEIFAILINVSFVGGYNIKLQNLLIHQSESKVKGFLFLGKISDLVVKITKLRFTENKKLEVVEFVTNILRLVANLVHANIESQDFLIDHQYLPFYLSQSIRDQYNLHSKEVIVVFVKYMTESNLRARGLIESLTVEDFIKENANLIKKFDF